MTFYYLRLNWKNIYLEFILISKFNRCSILFQIKMLREILWKISFRSNVHFYGIDTAVVIVQAAVNRRYLSVLNNLLFSWIQNTSGKSIAAWPTTATIATALSIPFVFSWICRITYFPRCILNVDSVYNGHIQRLLAGMTFFEVFHSKKKDDEKKTVSM